MATSKVMVPGGVARASPQLGAPASNLLSTWAKQRDLPGLDHDLRETTWLIGDYEIHRKLGEGEFASVYECAKEDADPAAPRVAIKAIKKAKVQRHTSVFKSRRNIARVNLEVKAMRLFSHAGVCRLYDVMHSARYVYLVLERGDRDLYTFLNDHPAGCGDATIAAIMRILALALRHCHNARIAHRDLKPERASASPLSRGKSRRPPRVS